MLKCAIAHVYVGVSAVNNSAEICSDQVGQPIAIEIGYLYRGRVEGTYVVLWRANQDRSEMAFGVSCKERQRPSGCVAVKAGDNVNLPIMIEVGRSQTKDRGRSV